MIQHRFKAISALGALAATMVLCFGISCSQTTPDAPAQPHVAPSTISAPADKTVTEGSSAAFSVTVNADAYPAPTFQWEVLTTATGATWTAIADATTSSYTWTATAVTDSGAKVRCVATNDAGSVTSAAATLTVNSSYVPPTPPEAGDVLVKDLSSAQSTTTLAPNYGYGWAINLGFTYDGKVGDTYTVVAKGTLGYDLPAAGAANFPAGKATLELKFMENANNYVTVNSPNMVLATGPQASGYAFDLTQDLPITAAPVDATKVIMQIITGDGAVDAASSKIVNFSKLEIWKKPTPPHAGQTLLYSFPAGDFNIAATQYGFQNNNKALTLALLPGASGDKVTIVVKGVTAYDAAAGDPNIECVIANTNPNVSYWDELTNRGKILDNTTAHPSGSTIDAQFDLTFKKAAPSDVMYNLQTSAGGADETGKADEHLTLTTYEVWKY